MRRRPATARAPGQVLVVLVALGVLGGLATGCTNSEDQPSPAASPGESPVTSTSSAPDGTASDSASPASSTSGSSATPPSGGTSDAPAPVTAATDLLHWSPVHGNVENAEILSGSWTLTVNATGASYDLEATGQSLGSSAPTGYRLGTALLDQDWAVAVFQDKKEEATMPDRAQVTDLATGKQFVVDHDANVPTTIGGTWALGGDTLIHATTSSSGAYCLATVDLATQTATRGYCAAPKHGFNAGHVSPAGTTLLTFDSSRPSCRTVGSVTGTAFTPFPGVTPCKAWEGVLLEPVDGQDAAVWSVIPKENQIEAADFQARIGSSYYDLGPGTSGTLVPCHGAAYFVRDPQRDGQPASLMRWDGHSLATVYQAPPGQSFLATPRCGDSDLTVTAFSEGGDEQVTAPLG